MSTQKNELWPEDCKLFATMKGQYISENEKTFFEKMKYKMEYEITLMNDLIMFELDNEDHIYIVRVIYDEIIIGHGTEGSYAREHHVMNLSEALNSNLKELGYIDRDITLFQWLRERDYKGIMYNHNADLM